MRSIRCGPGLALLLALGVSSSGCAARWAYHKGRAEAKKGNWDVAVARLTRAVQKDPDNIGYKIALDNARLQASRYHYKEAKKHLGAEDLEKATEELDIATKFDPSNKSAIDDLAIVQDRIRKREEEKQRLADFEQMKARAAAKVPLPVLSPRSPVPITLKFTDTSLEKVFETLSKLTGVNILMGSDFRDKRVNVSLANVTFEEALDRLTFVNGLFYKVLDQNTIIVAPETPANRRKYDEALVRTFYLQNADVNETLTLVRNLTGITKAAGNPSLGAITIMGTPDKLALAQRIIETNDKAKGEVMVEVQILEVNRKRTREYGIRLSNYEAGIGLAPTGNEEVKDLPGFTTVRAQILSSLNLSDYIVKIPASILTRFLEDSNNARLLASPRLRAAEGKKTSLKIVSQIPVAQTTFQATTTGGATLTPTTTIQYKDVGVILDLTPKINAAGDVTLEMSAEFSLLGPSFTIAGGEQPSFLTRNLNGILRVRNGETSVIGGLLQGRDADTVKGALGLQNIPILGKLLNDTQKEKEETEILISITPHIVRAPKVTEEDLKALYAGTEEVPKVQGARPPLFGPLEASPSPSPSPAPQAPATPPPARPQATPGAAPSVPPSPLPSGSGPGGAAPPEASAAPVAAPAPAVPPAAAAGGPARWNPPQVDTKVGKTVALSVALVGVKDVVAVDLTLSWDPSTLELIDAGPGALLTIDAAAVGTQRQIEAGKAHVKFTRAVGARGVGAVVSLTVRALKPGLGLLTVDALTVTTADGAEQPLTPGQGRVLVQ